MDEVIPDDVTVENTNQRLAICNCENQSADDELYADGAGETMVLIKRTGKVTNRYADGVAGLSEEDVQTAKSDDEPYCPNCESHIRGWHHP